jgi:hypothetical protein
MVISSWFSSGILAVNPALIPASSGEVISPKLDFSEVIIVLNSTASDFKVNVTVTDSPV